MNAHREVSGETEDGEFFVARIGSRPGEVWVDACSPPELTAVVEQMLKEGLLCY